MQNQTKRAFISELSAYRNDLTEPDYSERASEDGSGLVQMRLLIGAAIGAVLGMLFAFIVTSDMVTLPQMLSSLGDNAIALVLAMFGIVFGILLSSKPSQY